MIISSAVRTKIETKHQVTVREVEQCFENRIGLYLEDDREDHRTDPATLWFIAETNRARVLKVIFIFADGNVHLKSAYEPEEDAVTTYNAKGR